DHLGTPQELTNPNGEIVWSAHYRAYGQIAKLDVNTVNNPLRFQGQYFDQESGLHYNRHRYYNPDNGRYLTPDPVKLAGGLNGYQYVPNPTGWVDPLGLSANCPGNEKSKLHCNKSSEPEAPEASRSGAFRQAKSDAKIPTKQHPNPVFDAETGQIKQFKYIRMKDLQNNEILDTKGKPILTREYEYTREDGSKIVIQEHSAGHKFGASGGVGDQGAHFNLRPISNTRNGKLDGVKNHYNFEVKR
ncbi:type IV secretion protein Rhs, partial [Pseudomonas sp. ANT_H14]